MMDGEPIPVILDTDIGGDIDDTWALAMLLRSPELDLKLAVSDTGDTIYRARIIARMLEVAGRTDVPVGVGLRQPSDGPREHQAGWVEQYDLAAYPGTVHEDGVEAIIRVIMGSPVPVTLICIGPVPNIAAALDREPAIAEKARFIGMHGSVYRGYNGADTPAAEYNVKADIESCQKAFTAGWQEIVITPLDTCGIVRLKGDRYQRIARSEDVLMRTVIENYRIWADARGRDDDFGVRSSVLFDTVAVYLAFTTRHLVMKRMGVRVDDEGFTVPDEQAREMDVAVDWEDMDAFEEFLVRRLLGEA